MLGTAAWGGGGSAFTYIGGGPKRLSSQPDALADFRKRSSCPLDPEPVPSSNQRRSRRGDRLPQVDGPRQDPLVAANDFVELMSRTLLDEDSASGAAKVHNPRVK